MTRLFHTFLFFVTGISTLIAQTTYYVSNSGNNGNSGTLAAPWQTIQYGLDQLSAGDVLLIRGGSYPEKLFLQVSGTAGNMITIKNYPNETVVVDADSFNDNTPVFFAENQSYYRIEGLHFTNVYSSDGAGMLIQGYGSNIEIINNTFSNIAISRNVNAAVNSNTNIPVVTMLGTHATTPISNVLIQGNTVYDCRPGFSECISLWGNVDGFEMSNNLVYNNANIGLDAGGNYGDCPTPALDHARNGVIKNNICHHNVSTYSASAGIYLDGAWSVIVENNTSYANGYGIEIGCEQSGSCKDIKVRNNVLYENRSVGLALGGYDVATGGYVDNCIVTNNTLYHNDVSNSYNGELLITEFRNSTISENIFYISAQNFFMGNDRSQPNMTMDYNLVYCVAGQANVEAYWDGADLTGLSNIYTTTGTNAHSTFGDPLFVNPGAADFHIATNSPAVNAGDPAFTPASGEVDMDGENRVYQTVDCGADEIQSPMAVVFSSPLIATVVGDEVALKWETAIEENAAFFEIQSSPDARSWTTIGKVSASGDSNGALVYTYTDRFPLAGQSYYRLKQVDFDGNYNVSTIAAIFFKKPSFVVYPNPARRFIQVEMSDVFSNKSYQIINENGYILRRGILELKAISLDNIPNGVYCLRVFDANGSVWCCRFLKI